MKLDELQSLMPDNIDAYYLMDARNTKEICVKGIASGSAFATLIGELNEYSRKNIGTTDFAVIQNKTERYVKMQYDNAVSKLAFPTYWGLMGTFIGVFLGLLFFSSDYWLSLFGFGGADNSSLGNDDKVYQLICGVLVSMSTSFVGLWFTTRSNEKSSVVKKVLDLRKNIFYDFIQNEMMPAMGTSMVVALTKLRETLGTFEPAFGRIISSFKTTFDECTSKFGENFNVTVKTVTDAAKTLGGSIAAVNDNVRYQRELLNEMRSGEMMNAINSFLMVCEALENSSDTLKSFMESEKSVEKSTRSLVAAQQKYIDSLAVPQTIAERLNDILDRVTTFEESINNLGTALDHTELVSNKTIASIEQHLQSVKAKNDIAEAYVEIENDQLKNLFEEHRVAIDDLHHKYVSLLADHQDGLEKTLDEVGMEMMKARNRLITKLSTAFDLLSLNGEFAHLSRLPEIKETLDKLMEEISSLPPEVSKLVAGHVSKEYQLIGGLASNVQDNAQHIDRKINEVKDRQDTVAESLDKIGNMVSKQITDVKQAVMESKRVVMNNIDSARESSSESTGKGFMSTEAKIAELQQAIAALTVRLQSVSDKSNSIDSKMLGLNTLAKQLDGIRADVESLKVYNEKHPAEKLELGSLTDLSKMIDAQRKKVDEAIKAIEAHTSQRRNSK